ncbi:MAG TPA: tetratricopeptide repeat protein, partial [Acidobacteriaceae bacterium]|nr:tetratricopeptide repeat protein [Acidobacteriaceae bacterium]
DIRFEIRNALQPLGERGRIFDYLQEAEILANRLGDARRMGWIQSYFTERFWILGRHADAMVAGERALIIGKQLSDLALQVVTNLPLGLAHHTRGDYRQAIEHFQWNATRLDNDHASDRFGLFVLPSSFSLSFIAWALAELGDFNEGSVAAERGLQIAEAARHPFSCGYAHLGLGVLELRRGRLQEAQHSFHRALDADGFADSPIGFSYVAFHLGYAQALARRPEDGILLLEQTAKVAETRGFVARHALRLAYLSEAYLISGRVDDAAAIATRALEFANEHDERANQAYSLRVLAEVDSHSHRFAEAERRFSEALRLAQALGMRPLQAHCHRGLAIVHEANRQSQQAAFHHKAAMALADAMQMRFWGDPYAKPLDFS